jgi:hypothetical protein
MLVPRSDLSTKNDPIQKGTSMNKLVELYCDVDDFCKLFIPQWGSGDIPSAKDIIAVSPCLSSPAEGYQIS